MGQYDDNLRNPDAEAPSGLRRLIDELEREESPARRDHLRARFDMAIASYRAEQEWEIFAAQSNRAAREATDAMQRHKEAQATATATAAAADAHAAAALAQATSANTHAKALKVATIWLSVSTGVLAVATIVLVWVTWTKAT